MDEIATSTTSWEHSVHGYIYGVVAQLAYGTIVAPDSHNDPKVATQMSFLREFEKAAQPSFYIMNMWPLANWIPTWCAPRIIRDERSFRDAYLKEEERHLLGSHDRARLMLLGPAKGGVADDGSWSYSRMFHERPEKFGLSAYEAAYTLGAFVEATLAGTPGTLILWVLAMLHYPAWQESIQVEVDAVLGRGEEARAVRSEDSERMPTVRAAMRETLRWRPILPAGMPHAIFQDDVYEGYHIPKGATVIWHHWLVSSSLVPLTAAGTLQRN